MARSGRNQGMVIKMAIFAKSTYYVQKLWRENQVKKQICWSPVRLCIRLFSRHIPRTQSFQENHLFNFQACVVLKPPVSLIGRLVACSTIISVDTQRLTSTRSVYLNGTRSHNDGRASTLACYSYLLRTLARPCQILHELVAGDHE